jgi:NAD(P)-dependent dehydrogenase (short-subunit alcohol dehydrogenase family)
MAEGRFTNPVVASLAGVKDFFSKQKLADRYDENQRIDGLNCLVTGANSGLGYALAVNLAARGGNVVMACRREIPEAGERVKAESGSGNVEMRYLDLSKIDTIHDFCNGLVRDDKKLDVVILNAGVALPKSRKTPSGLEEMFLVNYLSNFILINLFLEKGIMRQAGKDSFIPRIIVISSDSHQGSSFIDQEEFGIYKNYGVSKGMSYYSYYKLVLNTWATELSRRINKNGTLVSVNAICPGPVHSNIIKEAPFFLRLILGGIFKIIFKSPKEASKAVVYMAISKDYEGKTNEYLHMFNPKKMDKKIYLPEEGKKLWEYSGEVWKRVDEKATIIL